MTKEGKSKVQLRSILKRNFNRNYIKLCIYRTPVHNARIRFDLPFPNHASYLMKIYSYFYNLTGKGLTVLICKPDKRTGKIYS